MMDQIDVYGDDLLHTFVKVCMLPPLNDYYSSSLCAGCHYTSDLSILKGKKNISSSVTPPPPPPPRPKLCSHKLKTHTHSPAVSRKQAGTDDGPILGCVCRLRLPKKHTEAGGPLGVTTVTKRRSHPVFGNNHWQRQAFPDSFGWFPQGVVPPRCLIIAPIIDHLLGSCLPKWRRSQLIERIINWTLGSKCTKKACPYLPELCLMSVSKSQSEATIATQMVPRFCSI